MGASLSGVFNLQEFTDFGLLGAGMRLYTYAPATTTLKVAYTDEAGTIPHTYTNDGSGGQYIGLNSRGELPAPLFLASGGYDLTLKTVLGVTVWTRRAVGSTDAAVGVDTAIRSDFANTTDPTKGDADLGVKQPFAGAIARTQHDHNAEFVTMGDAGAVGDGNTDDTAPLYLIVTRNLGIDLRGKNYLAKPVINTSIPALSSNAAQITNGSFKVKADTYYRGVPGQLDNYGFFRLTGAYAMAFGTNFDGNGQATIAAYQPSGANVHFFPVILEGNKRGQKAIANTSISAGGHGIEGSQGSQMTIALNAGFEHNGIGATNTASLILCGNTSASTTDSHFYVNSVTGFSVVGNTGISSTNGGGLDLAGASDGVASGNTFAGGSSNAVWVLKSPNTGALYNRLLVSATLAYNNCNYPNNEQGEFQIGDYNNPAAAQGSDCALIANFALPQDTPGGSGFNNAFWIHKGATRTAVLGNVISPAAALITASVPMIKDMGSTRPAYVGNTCLSESPGLVFFDAAPVGYAQYANNSNLRIHPSSVGIPSRMEEGDGYWRYHIVRKLPISGKTVMDIFYPGGLIHDVIEVTLSQTNDNGMVSRRICARGQSGAPVTVLDNTQIFSFGSKPPAITVDTSVNGRLRINSNANATGVNNEDCVFDIKITTPADAPSRFVPIFA